MSITTLTIDVVAKMATLERDMGKVVKLSEQTASRMNSVFKVAGAGVAGLFAGLSFGAAATGFRNIVNEIDALNDAADATGSSIEKLSGLEDFAKRTGAQFEDVTSVLIKFNGVLKEADGKNGASKALEAIGVSAERLRQLDPADALQEVAVALSGYADDGNKARLVQELFGKSIREAAPLLKDLAEAGELNGSVTDEQAQAAERFNRQIFALQANLSSLTRDIVGDAVPALNSLFEAMKKGDVGAFGVGGKGYQQSRDLEYLRNAADAAKRDYDQALQFSSARRVLAFGTSDIDALKKRADAAKLAADEAQKAYYGVTKLGGGRGVVNPDPIKATISLPQDKPTQSGAAAQKLSEAQRYIDRLREQVAGVNELSAVERARYDLGTREMAGTSARDRETIMSLAAQVDANKALLDTKRRMLEIDELIADMVNEKRRAEAQAADEATRYFEASLTPAEELERTIKRINELYEQGAFGADAATAEERRARSIEAARDKYSKLNETAKEFSDIMVGAIQNGQDLGKALEQIALKAFIFDPLSKALEDLFKTMAKPSAVGAGGGALSFLGSLFGGFFADGGSPPVGKVSVVGERGPELFIPKQAGTIVPNHKLGGVNVTVNPTYNIGDGVSANAVYSAVAAGNQALKNDILRTLTVRGVL